MALRPIAKEERAMTEVVGKKDDKVFTVFLILILLLLAD